MIKIRNLCKVFGKKDCEVHALAGVDIDVEPGGFLAIMGPSGSGKSTLMNVLGCLDRQTSGSYFLNGIDVASLNPDQTAELRNRYIGFVFQSFFLLPRMTAFENVELPLLYAGVNREERQERVAQLLESVGLAKRASHLPSELSGGQCQRIAIARALANSPKLLLADEPTGNLDSKTSMEIMDIIRRLNRQGVTVVLITHEIEIAQCAKELRYLRDGKLYTREEYECAVF